tara:strand:+ start:175 stop:495 length:321 start_codon:yes stop_codon:yes gene_type:complete
LLLTFPDFAIDAFFYFFINRDIKFFVVAFWTGVKLGKRISVLFFLIDVDAILMESVSTLDENFERTFVLGFSFFNEFVSTDVANVLLKIVLVHLSPHPAGRCVVAF